MRLANVIPYHPQIPQFNSVDVLMSMVLHLSAGVVVPILSQ